MAAVGSIDRRWPPFATPQDVPRPRLAGVTATRGRPTRILANRLPDAAELGRIATERASSMTGNTYGHASVNSNLVGLYGEAACHVWLRMIRAQDVYPNYLDSAAKCDLTLLPHQAQLEVKTSRLPWWRQHGAVLTGIQVSNILQRDALIWCVVGPDVPTNAVWLLGWVSAPTLTARLEPVVVNTGSLSFFVSELDELGTLPAWLANNLERFASRDEFAMVGPSAPRGKCARGHTSVLSFCLTCWWLDLGGPERVYVVNDLLHARSCPAVPDPPPWFSDADQLLSYRVCTDCLPGVLPESATTRVTPWD